VGQIRAHHSRRLGSSAAADGYFCINGVQFEPSVNSRKALDACDYFVKPQVDLEDLDKRLERCLARAGRQCDEARRGWGLRRADTATLRHYDIGGT
jgi:hypothetical protein